MPSKTIQTADSTVTSFIITPQRKSRQRNTRRFSLVLHWKGKLHRKGAYADGQYIGIWKTFYDTDILQQVVSYLNGLPEGETQTYSEKGVLIQQGSDHEGKEEGEWKFFDDEGGLQFEGSYFEGKPNGIWYKHEKGVKKVYKKYKRN